ncbi:Protein kinase-like domain containing protein [Rhypophila decipiens]
MSSPQDHYDYDDEDTRFLLPQNVGIATEDVEDYRPGGLHPVHLGDTFDGGRYNIVHKLGSGGYSTHEKKWVALKIVTAEQSTFVLDKTALSQQAISGLLASGTPGYIAGYLRQFSFEGPNGHHPCLVLPVLGPSASDLFYGFCSRLRPWIARKAGYEVTKALAALHSQGLCHGESDIINLFGPPATGELQTESGEETGPEAPRYIVKALDFLSSPSNIITNDIKITDFDQCFAAASPPKENAGPASDVWALGCCLFRLRSGESPFENPYQVTSPADLLAYVIQTLGDLPPEWQEILWDDEGQPTRDPSKGMPLDKSEDELPRPLKGLVCKIWDGPEGRLVQTGTASGPEVDDGRDHHFGERIPYPACFSNMAWKPTAVKVDNTYLYGYNDECLKAVKKLPQIAKHEADLLLDLLSKIFIYDPKRRPTAKELLEHPWFRMDGEDAST